MWAQNKRDGVDKAQGVAKEFSLPAVTDWKIISLNDVGAVNYASAITQAGTGSTQPTGKSYLGCFMSTGASRHIFAVPDDRKKFPIFVIKADGTQACRTGEDKTKETFNTGCNSSDEKTEVQAWN